MNMREENFYAPIRPLPVNYSAPSYGYPPYQTSSSPYPSTGYYQPINHGYGYPQQPGYYGHMNNPYGYNQYGYQQPYPHSFGTHGKEQSDLFKDMYGYLQKGLFPQGGLY